MHSQGAVQTGWEARKQYGGRFEVAAVVAAHWVFEQRE